MPMTAQRPLSRQPKHLDAGIFQAEINSFALRLAAESKAAKTIRTYTEAVQWFAATSLPGRTGRGSWERVTSRDIQRWMAWLLGRYSAAYASNQYRALQQFFKWLAAEDQLSGPMAGLAPPGVPGKLVPVFTSEELARLEQACAGRSFTQRRDTAIIAVLATGIRLSEVAGLRCRDVDLWQRGADRPRQGRQGPDRQDRPPGRPQPGPVPAGPLPARPGLAAPAVARRRQPGAADRRRDLPDDRPPRPPMRSPPVPAPVPAPLLPYLARPRRTRG
jgi:integrase